MPSLYLSLIHILPELKYIGVLATGYNVVDTAAAKERGIIVTNIPAYSTASVAQMVFAHILNISQQVQRHSEEVHKGRWTNSKDFCFWDTPLMELRDKKIGLVGLGNTGYTTARVAICLLYTSNVTSGILIYRKANHPLIPFIVKR